MKKTDTCYYMSITKEENSAFVVANQGGDPNQVVTESKTDGQTSHTEHSTIGGQHGTTVTTTTPLGTNATTPSGIAGNITNGTSVIPDYRVDDYYNNNDNNNNNDENNDEEICLGPRGPNFDENFTQVSRAPPTLPQVILQVLPSTNSPPLQHNLLIASDVCRECRMR